MVCMPDSSVLHVSDIVAFQMGDLAHTEDQTDALDLLHTKYDI